MFLAAWEFIDLIGIGGRKNKRSLLLFRHTAADDIQAATNIDHDNKGDISGAE